MTRTRLPPLLVLFFFALLWPAFGTAQESNPGSPAEAEASSAAEAEHAHEHHAHEVETFSHSVTVTGSWIPGTPEDAPQPVSVISREDLEAEGSPSMLGMIRNLSFSVGADLESDQFGSRAGEDRSTLNLRGLGPSRSLVLLNGDRLTWSPGAIPDQAQLMVDTNVLPMVAVERVEFLRDGGAATYGSDAIAGVMNVITRSHFDGLSFEGKHSVIDGSNGDGEIGVIGGGPFGGGRGHAVTSLGLSRRSPIRLRERDWAVRPYAENPRGGWSGTGRPAVFHPLSGAPAIRDPNCELVGGAVSSPNSPLCRVQYTPFDNLVQDTRRGQWFTEASWDTEGGWHIGAEVLFARSAVPSWQTSPAYPPNKVVDPTRSVRANNPGLIDMARLYPDLYGPYAFCDAPYCGWQGDGGAQDAAGLDPAWQEVAWIRGRMFGQDGPLRSHLRESETQRLAFDLEGVAGETLWAFRASWSTAVRKFEDGDALDYRARRALAGLGGFACEEQVPNEYDASGNLSFSLDTLRRHAGQGDCGYSVFGELSLPLAPSIESQVSLRFEEYGGDVGSSLDPKFALRWQATDALALRGSFGTTFRGPTLNQTTSGIADTSRQFIDRIGTFKPIHIRGDPALDPESATTLNAGLVFERSGRLFATVDYWRYEFTDPLVIQPFNFILVQACPPATHPVCDPGSTWFDSLTISGAVPSIENLDTLSVRIVNGPDIDTDGIDLKAEFQASAGPGRLSLGASGTYTLSWRIDGWELGDAYDAKGRLNYDTSLARALPTFKGRLTPATRSAASPAAGTSTTPTPTSTTFRLPMATTTRSTPTPFTTCTPPGPSPVSGPPSSPRSSTSPTRIHRGSSAS